MAMRKCDAMRAKKKKNKKLLVEAVASAKGKKGRGGSV
jgi:hypothetical protein